MQLMGTKSEWTNLLRFVKSIYSLIAYKYRNEQYLSLVKPMRIDYSNTWRSSTIPTEFVSR